MSKLAPHVDMIRAALADGRGKADIARELGVSRSSLSEFISGGFVTRRTATRTPKHHDQEVSELELVKTELAELRRGLSKNRKVDVAEARVLNAIESALVSVPLNHLPLLDTFNPTHGPDAHHRQVLVLSDFHGGEIVDRDAVNGTNSYDWSVQQARVDEVIEAMRSHRRYSPELTGLDVLFVGDMCSGSNHAELAETNEYNAAEQGVKMGYLLGDIVARLAPEYGDVRVAGVVGNHPRTSIKPAAKNVWSNFDWVAYKVCEQYVANLENVSCDFPRAGALFHEVAGQTLYVWHGDGIRSSMPGVPWGGVMRRTNEIRRHYPNQKIDGWVLGHFHQCCVLADLGIYMNGSLKGNDEWVQKQFGGGSPPCQLLLTFDESRGRLTDTKYITPTAGL